MGKFLQSSQRGAKDISILKTETKDLLLKIVVAQHSAKFMT